MKRKIGKIVFASLFTLLSAGIGLSAIKFKPEAKPASAADMKSIEIGGKTFSIEAVDGKKAKFNDFGGTIELEYTSPGHCGPHIMTILTNVNIQKPNDWSKDEIFYGIKANGFNEIFFEGDNYIGDENFEIDCGIYSPGSGGSDFSGIYVMSYSSLNIFAKKAGIETYGNTNIGGYDEQVSNNLNITTKDPNSFGLSGGFIQAYSVTLTIKSPNGDGIACGRDAFMDFCECVVNIEAGNYGISYVGWPSFGFRKPTTVDIKCGKELGEWVLYYINSQVTVEYYDDDDYKKMIDDFSTAFLLNTEGYCSGSLSDGVLTGLFKLWNVLPITAQEKFINASVVPGSSASYTNNTEEAMSRYYDMVMTRGYSDFLKINMTAKSNYIIKHVDTSSAEAGCIALMAMILISMTGFACFKLKFGKKKAE